MSAAPATVPNPAGDIARIGALLAAIKELACQLESRVAGRSTSSFNFVTAIQACAEVASRQAQSADEALALAAKSQGGAA